MKPPLSAAEFLQIADHTLLKPDVSSAEVLDFMRGAESLGVRRICISPTQVAAATAGLAALDRQLEIVSVVGFPSGVHIAAAKAFEAAAAVAAGASEIDMVLNPALVQAGEQAEMVAEIAAVRRSIAGIPLKVIIESAALSDEQIVACCQAAMAAGADFVKTSTGFHAAGGASAHAVSVMAATVAGQLGVKASGGIRTAAAVRELWEAGANRFGVSATAEIFAGWNDSLPLAAANSGY